MDNKVARKKIEWLQYCLEIGWKKDQLSGLSDAWDKYYDENGNPQAVLQPSTLPQSVPLIDKGEPEAEMVSREEYENAVNEIGQLQEQLKDAENEIRELNRFNNERF